MIKHLSSGQQLALLREQTKRTGLMHEAQVLQLKYWPLVVGPDKVAVQLSWDTETMLVTYVLDLSICEDKDGLSPQARENLENWVKELLGKDWAVKVTYKR